MGSPVTPTGSSTVPGEPLFTSQVREKIKESLQATPRALPPESKVIQERLEEPQELEAQAAGIPGTHSLPETGRETEVQGKAVIAGAKAAKRSVEKRLNLGSIGDRTISKSPTSSAEKIGKLFPRSNQ